MSVWLAVHGTNLRSAVNISMYGWQNGSSIGRCRLIHIPLPFHPLRVILTVPSGEALSILIASPKNISIHSPYLRILLSSIQSSSNPNSILVLYGRNSSLV